MGEKKLRLGQGLPKVLLFINKNRRGRFLTSVRVVFLVAGSGDFSGSLQATIVPFAFDVG